MYNIERLVRVILALGIDYKEVLVESCANEYRTALVSLLRQPSDHSGSHIAKCFRRTKNGNSVKPLAIRAPDCVLRSRMAGEFPYRLLDEVEIGEVVSVDR